MKYSEIKNQQFQFWKNEPVMEFDENVNDVELISESMQIHDIILSDTQHIKNVDLNDESNMVSIVDFIKTHYQQENKYFLKDYTYNMIKWEIGINGSFYVLYDNNTIVGVVGVTTKKIQLWDEILDVLYPMFLTIHIDHLNKGFAVALIKKVINHGIEHGIKSGLFLTNKCVPSPFVKVKYFNRP